MMGELITRIMSLIENLLIAPLVWIFPIKWSIVPPGSSVVRFTCGHPSIDLKTGIHFATTTQTLQKQHTKTKWAIAESMYVLTEDGVSLKVRGVAIYSIISLAKYLTASDCSDDFVVEACEAAIKHSISLVPFEDLTIDSDTIEVAISKKISEICEDLGIEIKRYRFQDIELTDPIGRAFLSVKAVESRLTRSAQKMAATLSIQNKDAAIILSPNIQFVSNIESQEQTNLNSTQEEEDESKGVSE